MENILKQHLIFKDLANRINQGDFLIDNYFRFHYDNQATFVENQLDTIINS
jgi:hypothetical protein